MTSHPTPPKSSLWTLKEQVELDYPDFPNIDVAAPDFNIETYLVTLRTMLRAMGIPLQDVAVTWDSLSCTVPVEAPGEAIKTVVSSCTGAAGNLTHGCAKLAHHVEDDLQDDPPDHADILSNVSGFVKPASMCLVLGRSGSGSSLLLSRIAGRELGSIVHTLGQVLYNGEPKLHNIVSPAHFVHFVGQHDDHIPSLSVRHTLEFAAACKWPAWLPHVEVIRANDVALTARTLHITRTLDTIVGSEIVRGISGGERKRVTLAEMVIGMVGGVLVMDNWSKGLDSSTTLSITRSMREFTDKLRGTVITSMQAPGVDAFNVFDTVLVLDKGRVIYFGPRKDAEAWFISLGFVRPSYRSVPDFVATVTDPDLRNEYIPPSLDVASLDAPPPTTAEEFAERYAQSAICAKMNETRKELMSDVNKLDPNVPKPILNIAEKPNLQAPRHQIKAIGKRQLQYYNSIRGDVVSDMVLNLFLGVILGSIFWQLPDTSGGAASRGGIIFLSMLFIGLSALSKIEQKHNAKTVFAKQRSASFFSAWTYILSLTFFDVIYEFLKSIFFIVPLYLMAGLSIGSSAQRLLYAVLLTSVLSNVMIAMTRFYVALLDDKDKARGISGISTILFVLFAGFLKNKNDLQGYLIWLYWINPMHYAFEALAINEFDGLNFSCTSEELVPLNSFIPDEFRVCPVDTGDNYLSTSLGITVGEIFRLYDFLILVAFFVLFVTLSAVATARAKPVGHALKALIDAKKRDRTDVGDEYSTTINVKDVSSLHRPRARFTFSGVEYSVDKGQKVLLDKISGSAMGGSVVLLMGESGAGKSTLLDVCAMRKTLNSGTAMKGIFRVNGHEIDKETLSHLSGYCEQNDIHVGEATVYEAVQFSAKLRLPRSMSDTEKNNRVLDTIELLGLTPYSEVLVGSLGEGERKLLTMALEVVADPVILFLDEPTSGISASSALIVANALRRISNTGTSVICTVHQPSAEVFAKFDKLLLLKRGGKQVYFGAIGEGGSVIRNYFESRGATAMNKDANPADWMLDVVGDESVDWTAEWQNSSEKVEAEAEIGNLAQPAADDDEDLLKPFDRVSLPTQMVEVIRRTFWRYWRLPQYNVTRVILVTIIGILIGLVYLREITDTQQGSRLAFAALFLSIVPASLIAQNVIEPTVQDRAVFYRETSSGTYNPIAFHLALGLVEIPFMVVATTSFALVFYFMVGLDSSRFGYFFLAAQLLYYFAVALGIMMASITANGELAATRVTSYVSVSNVLSGFFITKPRIRSWWRWFVWINPYAYYLSGVIQNQLEDQTFICEADELGMFQLPTTFSSCVDIPGGEYADIIVDGVITGCSFCPVPDGETLIRQFEADEVGKVASLFILLGFIFVCRVIAGFGFVKLRFISR